LPRRIRLCGSAARPGILAKRDADAVIELMQSALVVAHKLVKIDIG
jgi:hypothetical protein